MSDRQATPPSAGPEDEAGLEELRALYRELPAPPPGDALRKRLQTLTEPANPVQAPQRLPQPAANSAASQPVAPPRRRWRVPAALAASIAASITVGLLVTLQSPPAPVKSAARRDADTGLPVLKKADSGVMPRTGPPQPMAAPAAPAASNEPAAPALPPPANSAGSLQSNAAPAPAPAAADRQEQSSAGGAQAEAKSKSAPARSDQLAATPAESAPAAAAPAAGVSGVSGASAAAPAAGIPDTADGWYAEVQRREAAGDHAGAAALFEQFRKRYPDDPRGREFPAGKP